MDGPNRGFRAEIGFRAVEARSSEDEQQLERVLERIEEEVRRDLELGPASEELTEEAAWDQLSAIEGWAGLASNAIARFYAPASPWPHNVAGWSKKAVARLRSIANALKPALQTLLGALHAVGFTIGVGFPWGISIALAF